MHKKKIVIHHLNHTNPTLVKLSSPPHYFPLPQECRPDLKADVHCYLGTLQTSGGDQRPLCQLIQLTAGLILRKINIFNSYWAVEPLRTWVGARKVLVKLSPMLSAGYALQKGQGSWVPSPGWVKWLKVPWSRLKLSAGATSEDTWCSGNHPCCAL